MRDPERFFVGTFDRDVEHVFRVTISTEISDNVSGNQFYDSMNAEARELLEELRNRLSDRQPYGHILVDWEESYPLKEVPDDRD